MNKVNSNEMRNINAGKEYYAIRCRRCKRTIVNTGINRTLAIINTNLLYMCHLASLCRKMS